MIKFPNANLPSAHKSTPIKIRGKKSIKRQRPALSASLPDSCSIDKPAKRKRHEELRSATWRLEALPVEILEQIFLLSLSPQLALASPHILVKLSHRRTLLEFAVKCFGYLRSAQGEHLVVCDDLPLKPDRLVLDARAQVLRFPWMSYEFFENATTTIAERGRQKLQRMAPSQALNQEFFAGLNLWLGPDTFFPEKLFRTTFVPSRKQFLQRLKDAGVSTGSANSYINEMATELILHGIRTRDKSIIEMDLYNLSMMPSVEQIVNSLESVDFCLTIVEAVERLCYPHGREDRPGRRPFERIGDMLGPKASEHIKRNVKQAGGLDRILDSLKSPKIHIENS